MKKSLSKKAKKVIEEGMEEFMSLPPLMELTRLGAKMMLQSALEEEVTTYLQRDYYERTEGAKGSRSGSKPRTVKIGSGDIGIKMPQTKNSGGPFHSRILPPRVTQMDEIQEIIPLLYMNGSLIEITELLYATSRDRSTWINLSISHTTDEMVEKLEKLKSLSKELCDCCRQKQRHG